MFAYEGVLLGVPPAGLEPARPCGQRILSSMRPENALKYIILGHFLAFFQNFQDFMSILLHFMSTFYSTSCPKTMDIIAFSRIHGEVRWT